MLRVRHFFIALFLALFPLGCAPVGCSGEDPEQDKPSNEQFVDAVEQSLPAPGARTLYGTWQGDVPTGQFGLLALMTDGRFHGEQNVVCIKAPCDPVAREGRYKLYARENRTFIEFRTLNEDVTDRYEYAVSQGTLRLRPLVQGSEWYSMNKASIAWCANENDCTVQNLPPGICAGGYRCATHACTWKCGTSESTAAR